MESENKLDIKKWKMEKPIGNGTFGKVYVAIYLPTQQKYALKRVNKEEMRKKDYEYLLDAYYRELECMIKCNCENSVKYYKHFESKKNLNIIMELCDSDLDKELDNRIKGYNAKEIKKIMSQLNNAFKKLNENNLVHRDLKLGNILIKYTNESKTEFIPKLADYGLSKDLKKKKTSTHLGTPATMAPEVIRNQSYDSKADLWSVGVIIYQLHFKEYPYGLNEETILKNLENKTPYKKAEDLLLRDLIDKLLQEDQNKRLSWDEYFQHPFFAKESQLNTLNILNNKTNKGNRYLFIKDFDVGFKSEYFKCYIALDQKRNRNVLVKSYNKDFINQHLLYFKKECKLINAFKGNEYVLQLVNIEYENNYANLIYKYIDSEILSNYITHHNITEEILQKINNILLKKIFLFNELYFKSFIFISIYSFVITSDGTPILFDFGINKLLISSDELLTYYISNKAEIGNSISQSKTNVMNYGITLLKCFYGNDLKIIKDEKKLYLSKNKTISYEFENYLSKCLYRDISKRSNWYNLNSHTFVKFGKELNDSIIKQKITDLIDDCMINDILGYLNNKFKLINEYYEKIEFNENTEFINQIEVFLNLVLFEELIVLQFLTRSYYPYTPQNEIFFLLINNDGSSRYNIINYANPFFDSILLIKEDINESFFVYISRLKDHIKILKKICLSIHKITKSSLFKGNYLEFIQKFIEMVDNSKFIFYFYSIFTKLNNYLKDEQYEKACKEIPIAECVCEYILFYYANIFNNNEYIIQFDCKEYIKQFHDIFKDEIGNIFLERTKASNKYLSITFLGILFRYYYNSMNIIQNDLQQKKYSPNGMINYYIRLKELYFELNNKKK